MAPRLVDITLENLSTAPPQILDAVFWEMEGEAPADPRFQKEEWFSSTLLEWGPCGKLAVEGDEVVGYAQYAPPSLFPRVATFPAGRVSADAVYLAHCFVTPPHRRRGVGSAMVRAVGRDLVERGFRAIEALGEREWREGWVLPASFLEANRFAVVRDDPAVPLLRLDLFSAVAPGRARMAAALPSHR